MGRAVLLLAAAVAIAFLPVNRIVRIVVVAALVAAAGVFGFLVDEQERDRAASETVQAAAERARWQSPAPGLVQIRRWEPLAPLDFRARWVVDVVADVVSPASDEITGIEITAEALDCPDASAAAPACTPLARAPASETFLTIAPDAERRLRLRFEFPGGTYPTKVLRLVPTVTAVRR